MKIYLVRHGQTDWNKEMRAQGRKDIPLNAVGRAQAEELHEKIKDSNFDAVYASPLSRAAETAKIAIGGKYVINYDNRLVERSFGDYEGKIIVAWLDLVEGVDISDVSLDEIPRGVETAKSMLQRAGNFINDLKLKCSSDAKILVFGHGGMFRAFDWILLKRNGNSLTEANNLKHAEIKEYEI